MASPQTARESPSTKPPPDKRISNEQTTPQGTPASNSKSNQLNSVVSEASVLPPPPPVQPSKPRGLPQPTSSQSTSRESLEQRSTSRPSSSKQLPQEPTVGYQGTPQSLRTVEDIMDDYPDFKVKNSGPTGPHSKPSQKNFYQAAYIPESNAKQQREPSHQGRPTNMGIGRDSVF